MTTCLRVGSELADAPPQTDPPIPTASLVSRIPCHCKMTLTMPVLVFTGISSKSDATREDRSLMWRLPVFPPLVTVTAEPSSNCSPDPTVVSGQLQRRTASRTATGIGRLANCAITQGKVESRNAGAISGDASWITANTFKHMICHGDCASALHSFMLRRFRHRQ